MIQLVKDFMLGSAELNVSDTVFAWITMVLIITIICALLYCVNKLFFRR